MLQGKHSFTSPDVLMLCLLSVEPQQTSEYLVGRSVELVDFLFKIKYSVFPFVSHHMTDKQEMKMKYVNKEAQVGENASYKVM